MVTEPGDRGATLSSGPFLTPIEARQDAADRLVGRRCLLALRIAAVIAAAMFGTMGVLKTVGMVTAESYGIGVGGGFALLGVTGLVAVITCRRPARRQVDGLTSGGIVPAGWLPVLIGGIGLAAGLYEGRLTLAVVDGVAVASGLATLVLLSVWRARKSPPYEAAPADPSEHSTRDVRAQARQNPKMGKNQRSDTARRHSRREKLRDAAMGWPPDWRRRSKLLFPYAAHAPETRSLSAGWSVAFFPAVARHSPAAYLLGLVLPLVAAASSLALLLGVGELNAAVVVVMLLAGFAIMLGPSYLASYLLRRPYWQPQGAPLMLLSMAIGLPLLVLAASLTDRVPKPSVISDVLDWATVQAMFLFVGTGAACVLWGLVAFGMAINRGVYRRDYMDQVDAGSRRGSR